jgi:transcriptional regulator with XRE-family HTH domain
MEVNLKHRFGQLVAAHRKRRKLTQARLAELAEISTDMIARIESGASGARFQTVEKIAAALQVDVAELFTADLPTSALERPKLAAISRRLARESDADLEWLAGMLDTLLRKR